MTSLPEYTTLEIEPSEAQAMASLLSRPTPSTKTVELSPFETFINQLERVYHSVDNGKRDYYLGSINCDRRGNPFNTFILNRELNVITVGINTNSPLFVKPVDNDSVVVFSLNAAVNGVIISREKLGEEFDKLVANLSDSKEPSAVLFAQILTEYKTLAGA